MNQTATKKIKKLCSNKDRNMYVSLIRIVGQKVFDQKSAVGIYRLAKKHYHEFYKKDQWGKFIVTLYGKQV